MERNNGREILTPRELFVHDMVLKWREEEHGGSPSNKYLAQLMQVSRKEVRRIRKSVRRKLNLHQGF